MKKKSSGKKTLCSDQCRQCTARCTASLAHNHVRSSHSPRMRRDRGTGDRPSRPTPNPDPLSAVAREVPLALDHGRAPPWESLDRGETLRDAPPQRRRIIAFPLIKERWADQVGYCRVPGLQGSRYSSSRNSTYAS